jgi:hypothetical protein
VVGLSCWSGLLEWVVVVIVRACSWSFWSDVWDGGWMFRW